VVWVVFFVVGSVVNRAPSPISLVTVPPITELREKFYRISKGTLDDESGQTECCTLAKLPKQIIILFLPILKPLARHLKQ
jgi:hypothetical protein